MWLKAQRKGEGKWKRNGDKDVIADQEFSEFSLQNLSNPPEKTAAAWKQHFHTL